MVGAVGFLNGVYPYIALGRVMKVLVHRWRDWNSGVFWRHYVRRAVAGC